MSRLQRRKYCVLGLFGQPVVLGMEDRMNRRQADILVHAAVAGDVVRVEEIIVIDGIQAGLRIDDRASARDFIVISDRASAWIGCLSDVDQELVAGADGAGQGDSALAVAIRRGSSSRTATCHGTVSRPAESRSVP